MRRCLPTNGVQSLLDRLPKQAKRREILTPFRNLSDDELTARLRDAEARARLLLALANGPSIDSLDYQNLLALSSDEIERLRKETKAVLADLRAERRRRP